MFLLAPATPVSITVEVAIASSSSSVPEVVSVTPSPSVDPAGQPRVTSRSPAVPTTISGIVAVNELGALLIVTTKVAPIAALAENLGRHGQHEQRQDRHSNQFSRNH